MVGIYKITSPSNKIYIGQSIDIERRKANYKKLKTDNQIRLENSLKKYGFENHLFEILELCTTEKLNEKERYWQDFYNVLGKFGLNCRLTEANDKSGSLSDETKQKISNSKKGKVFSEEHKKKLKKPKQFKDGLNPIKGKTWEERFGVEVAKEMKKQSSISHIGQTNSYKGKTLIEVVGLEKANEIKDKYRKAQSGKKLQEITKEKISTKLKKKVIIDEIVYDSLSDAALALKCSYKTMITRLKNEKLTNYNYLKS